MNENRLRTILREGEGYRIGFKECANSLSNSVFETVCSFSNRYGGYIFLGVKEKDGRYVVSGVNPSSATQMKKNFINLLNNPEKTNPSLYLNLEELDYQGKKVLYVYVPVTSDIQHCDGKIFDRNGDADIDVSTSSTLVSNIANRKSADYAERRIFPYVTMDELSSETIEKARRLAVNRNPRHPWKDMDDFEMLKSASLYEKNPITGEQGFNLACILLFGKKEVISSCCPGYVSDALYRVENLDRYDDRLTVYDNLIESYDILMEFIAKHTDDRFFLIDDVSVSVRNRIAREIVSNILVHRDYSSAFPAKIIIDREKICTENWSKTNRMGRVVPDDFIPYPKNPVLSKIFMNIGYADGLGSGVRNLYKYTKMYSGCQPVLEEGEVFRTTIPLVKRDRSSSLPVHDMRAFGEETPVGDDEKLVSKIDSLLEGKTGKKAKRNIDFLLPCINKGEVFSTYDVSSILSCSLSGARELVKTMRENGIIKECKGRGKGRYVFEEFDS